MASETPRPYSVIAGIPFDVVIYNFKRHFVARSCTSCARVRDTLVDVSEEPFREPEMDIDFGNDEIRNLIASSNQKRKKGFTTNSDVSVTQSRKKKKKKRRKNLKQTVQESEEHRRVIRLLLDDETDDVTTEVDLQPISGELNVRFHDTVCDDENETPSASASARSEAEVVRKKGNDVSTHLVLYKQW